MTYAALHPGDKVSFGAPWYRTVKSVSKPYDLFTDDNGRIREAVTIVCTDGYTAEVLADLDAR